MDDIIRLIHSEYSIDQFESISKQLNLSHEQIHRILRADRYKDYFQLIQAKNQGIDQIALTLDVSPFIPSIIIT